MARPREFEPEEAVARAMELFWRKGYKGTSLQDLVDETGVNRGSLYSAFNDKHSLFLKALTHYRHSTAPGRISILEAAPGGLAAIRRYFDSVVADLLGPARGKGCLMVNSAVEMAAGDPQVALEVGRHLERLQEGFAMALGRAVEKGELTRPSQIPRLARFLTGVAQGLMVVGKARPDREALQDLYRPALESLSPN